MRSLAYTVIHIELNTKHVSTVTSTMSKAMSLLHKFDEKAIASSWLPKQRSAFVCFANFLVKSTIGYVLYVCLLYTSDAADE